MELIGDAIGEERCTNIKGRKREPTTEGKGECAEAEECATMWMVEDEEEEVKP